MILFSCRRAAELTSQALDAPLGPGEQLALSAHRAICAACRRYRDQLGRVDRAMAAVVDGSAADDSAGLSDEMKERLRQALCTDTAGDGPDPGVV